MYVSKQIKKFNGVPYRSYSQAAPKNIENLKKELATWGIGPEAYRTTLGHYPSGEVVVGFWVKVSRWPQRWPLTVWVED